MTFSRDDPVIILYLAATTVAHTMAAAGKNWKHSLTDVWCLDPGLSAKAFVAYPAFSDAMRRLWARTAVCMAAVYQFRFMVYIYKPQSAVK